MIISRRKFFIGMAAAGILPVMPLSIRGFSKEGTIGWLIPVLDFPPLVGETLMTLQDAKALIRRIQGPIPLQPSKIQEASGIIHFLLDVEETFSFEAFLLATQKSFNRGYALFQVMPYRKTALSGDTISISWTCKEGWL